MLGLMLIWGTSAGLFNATITILPQMLCSYGYNNVSNNSMLRISINGVMIIQEQSGHLAALTILVGVIGATIASFILDYTKMFKEVGVVSFGLAVLCFVWFVEVSVNAYLKLKSLKHNQVILPFHKGLQVVRPIGEYITISLCIWALCISSYSCLHGIRCGDYIPCC